MTPLREVTKFDPQKDMVLKTLAGEVPETPVKYCKQCGKQLANPKYDIRELSYDEDTGKPSYRPYLVLSCPDDHIEMYFDIRTDYTISTHTNNRVWAKVSQPKD